MTICKRNRNPVSHYEPFNWNKDNNYVKRKKVVNKLKKNIRNSISISLKLKEEIHKNQNYLCNCCNIFTISLNNKNIYRHQIDHIIPRCIGGSNDKSNLQSLCSNCHSIKTSVLDKDLRKYNDDEVQLLPFEVVKDLRKIYNDNFKET